VFICKKCGKEFDSGVALGGHAVYCYGGGAKKEKCQVCGALIASQVMTSHLDKHKNDHPCLGCGELTNNPKYCSRSCGTTYRNRKKAKPRHCKNCGVKLSSRQRTFCSQECHIKHSHRQYIERWLAGKMSGSTKSGEVSSHIRRYLFEANNNKCEICGWGKINQSTQKIPLQIHHIDGNYRNNAPDNLMLLCPNCHSLTDTYGGLNKGQGREYRYKPL
jgi:hypothetical protein